MKNQEISITGLLQKINQMAEGNLLVLLVFAPEKEQTPKMKEIFNEVERIFSGDWSIDFYSIDGDKYREVLGEFNIVRDPTILIFREGKEINRVGFVAKKVLFERIYDCL